MRINVPIELDSDQLVVLADYLDDKQTKRTATRADVCVLLQSFVAGLIDYQLTDESPAAFVKIQVRQTDGQFGQRREPNPALAKWADEIAAGLKRHRKAGKRINEKGYRQGWCNRGFSG